MRIVNLTGAESVVHPVHGTFQADADGVFDVPAELAVELLRFRTLWSTEQARLHEEQTPALVDLYDADAGLRLLDAWREQVRLLDALPPAERPLSPVWEPDESTLAWASMIVRNDQAGLREFAELRASLDRLRAQIPVGGEGVGAGPVGDPAGLVPAVSPAGGSEVAP